MATWDTLWWLLVGLLSGWVGLWVCDKLFLRDGQVAGLRAEREAAAARAELNNSRERLSRAESQAEVLKTDLIAHNDQADVLRTELAVMRSERNALNADLGNANDKVRIQQQEIESARKLATERVEHIERLEKQILDVQGERDKAQGWAQGRESEAAELTRQNHELQAELATANRVLATSTQKIDLAQRRARYLQARLSAGRPIHPREPQRLTGRMRELSAFQNTIDALAAADEARRDRAADASSDGGSTNPGAPRC